jgi:hypothetical protein
VLKVGYLLLSQKNQLLLFYGIQNAKQHEILFRPVFHQLHNHGLHYLREKIKLFLTVIKLVLFTLIDEAMCLVDQLVVAGKPIDD